MSRNAFPGDINTQHRTWTSVFLVINIVFFCRFLLDVVVASVAQLGCSHVAIGVPDFRPEPRRRQHGWT